jgi:hypothetical protein
MISERLSVIAQASGFRVQRQPPWLRCARISGRPARSRSSVSHRHQPDSPARTFCEKRACSCASRSTISPEPGLGGGQLRAGKDEVEVQSFEQSQLLGIQSKPGAPLMQVVDARKELGVLQDRVVVRGQPWRHLPFDRLQLRRGL